MLVLTECVPKWFPRSLGKRVTEYRVDSVKRWPIFLDAQPKGNQFWLILSLRLTNFRVDLA